MSDQQNPPDEEARQIAFVLYPGLTLLDMVGPLQTLGGLPAPYRTTVVGARMEVMPSDTPARIMPDATFDDVPHPFAIIVPGGTAGTIRAMADPEIQGYLRAASETAEVVGSVCTGALVLAAAGLLEGRNATTHWAFAEHLNRLGATYQRQRWVEDGKFITAAGVSAGIDMALQLAGRLAGQEYAKRIQAVIEYDPEPPFGPMDWELAKPAFWWGRIGSPDEQKAWLAGLLEGRPDLQERLAQA